MSERFRRARFEDSESILELLRTYYAEDDYPFSPEAARRALEALIADEQVGGVWVVEAKAGIGGYLAVTFGFSLEHLGRDAFVDELYLEPRLRGRGLGRQAIGLAEEFCRRHGVRALHLEVENHREAAYGLYRSAGFEDLGRRLLTKRLMAEP